MIEPCCVCGEPTTEYSNAVCSWCTAPFHLALRQDIPAKDCGQVWISEELLALEFACNTCLAAESGAAVPQTAPPAPAPESSPRRRYARHEGASPSALLRAKRRRRDR